MYAANFSTFISPQLYPHWMTASACPPASLFFLTVCTAFTSSWNNVLHHRGPRPSCGPSFVTGLFVQLCLRCSGLLFSLSRNRNALWETHHRHQPALFYSASSDGITQKILMWRGRDERSLSASLPLCPLNPPTALPVPHAAHTCHVSFNRVSISPTRSSTEVETSVGRRTG